MSLPATAQDGAFGAHRWPAPAKLNLFLHVTGRRPDGYHLLQTLFQFLEWGDELAFTPRRDGQVRRHGGLAGVAEADDLCVRAAEALRRHAGVEAGIDIHLYKRIPAGAGLGGGSSDAATTLVALNRLWGLGLDLDQLADIGLALGADVPVFVRGQAAWAEGIGEQLQPVDLDETWYLLALPDAPMPTAELYADPALRRDCPPVDLADYRAGRCGNVFEPLARRRSAELDAAMQWLAGHGRARLSGSGGACFVAVEDFAEAMALRAGAPAGLPVVVARGCNRSPLHARLACATPME